jgi:hypothetical protein
MENLRSGSCNSAEKAALRESQRRNEQMTMLPWRKREEGQSAWLVARVPATRCEQNRAQEPVQLAHSHLRFLHSIRASNSGQKRNLSDNKNWREDCLPAPAE